MDSLERHIFENGTTGKARKSCSNETTTANDSSQFNKLLFISHSMLEVRNVVKRFGDYEAIKPTNLIVPAGKCTSLIGPSGCGKSTLLRLMIRLIEPDEGTIVFDGVEVTAKNIREIRRRIGFVLQDGGLFPHLSIRENVALLARHLGWDKPRIDARIDELADLTRLPAVALGRYPLEVSGGQRQRVALMRALMLRPVMIMLDEPMGALDPLVRYDLQDDLQKIIRELGTTAILVTHDMGEAAFLGDFMVLMEEGRIVQQGSIRDLIETPATPFVTRFLNAQRTISTEVHDLRERRGA